MDSSPKPNSVDAFEKLLAHLPEPILLADVLSELRGNLASSPDAMLGEVGLDRVCRIPYAPPAATPYASNAEAHDRSPFTIPLAHQLAILEAQLDLAVELRRNVSLHSVKSQEATVTLLDKMKEKHKEKWTGISIDMHSCGVSVETLKDIQVCNSLLIARKLAPIGLTAETPQRLHFAVHCDQLSVTRT